MLSTRLGKVTFAPPWATLTLILPGAAAIAVAPGRVLRVEVLLVLLVLLLTPPPPIVGGGAGNDGNEGMPGPGIPGPG